MNDGTETANSTGLGDSGSFSLNCSITVPAFHGEAACLEVRGYAQFGDPAMCVVHVEIDGKRASFNADVVLRAVEMALEKPRDRSSVSACSGA